jgi:hypothetical protein
MYLDELTILIGGILLLGLGAGLMYQYFKKGAPEAVVLSACRRKKNPLGRIHWANGRESWEMLEKGDVNSMFFVKNNRPFKIDMRMYQQGKTSFINGLEVVDVWTDSLLPIGPMDAKAIFQSIDYLKDPQNAFPVLSSYHPRTMMTLVTMPDDKLVANIHKYIHINIEGMTKDDAMEALKSATETLLSEIIRAKQELSEIPLMPGPFLYPVACEAINNQLTNKIIDEMETELRELTVDEDANKEKFMMWIFGILAIIIGGAIAFFIFAQVLK